jgi:hypothetical protein
MSSLYPLQFVYPFTLEQHVVSLQPPPHVAIAERRAHLAAVLHAREVAEEQKEKAELHRVAPGYNPQSVLVPTHRAGGSGSGSGSGFGFGFAGAAASELQPARAGPPDPMDELVAQLEQMERDK